MATPQIQIRLPTPFEQTSPQFISHVVTLVNEAYSETESDLYKPGELRTNTTEVCNWLASKNFYLAFQPNADFPIGSVHLHKIDSSVTDIKILTVHRDARSLGLGRRLINHAEEVAVAAGAERARMEILVPKPPEVVEFKQYLRRWYGSLGYEDVRRVGIADVVPHMVESFVEGSEFLIMEKTLRK